MIVNLSGRVVRVGGVPIEMKPLKQYLWAPPGGCVSFLRGPTLDELHEAALVILPNILYCSIYPYGNCAYRKGDRVKKMKYIPPPERMIKVVINCCYGGFGLSKEARAVLAAMKGEEYDEDSYAFEFIERTDPDLIKLIEANEIIVGRPKTADLIVVEVDDNREWEITEYDGKEDIRYL